MKWDRCSVIGGRYSQHQHQQQQQSGHLKAILMVFGDALRYLSCFV